MDAELRMALTRLQRTTDFAKLVNHISGRRDLFVQSLVNTNPNDIGLVAAAQGAVRAFDEFIQLAEDEDNG